jgi:hypothetical protein
MPTSQGTLQESPTSVISNDEPSPAREQQECTRDNKTIVEHGDKGDSLGKERHITDLTRAHVGLRTRQ